MLKTQISQPKKTTSANALSHAVIIRFHYEDTDPRFHWRFAYFRSVVLPRLLSQTNQNFDICIRCNIWHKKLFESLHPKIKTFHMKREVVHYKKIRNKKYFIDFIPWSEVVGLPKYDIQTTLDSDDLIREDFIERIYEEVIRNGLDTSLHVHFQPKTFNLKTLDQGQFPEYTRENGSAFAAIYQPDKGNQYMFINECSHLNLGLRMQNSVKIGEGYCWATIHYHNESTGK